MSWDPCPEPSRAQQGFCFVCSVGTCGGLVGKSCGELLRGTPVGGLVKHPPHRCGDTSGWFSFAHSHPRPEPEHADRVVLLIAAQGHAGEGYAGGQSLEHAAVTGVRDHRRGFLKHLLVRGRSHHSDVGRGRHLPRSDGGARGENCSNGQATKPFGNAAQGVDLRLEGRAHRDKDERVLAAGGPRVGRR
jgi:hypothetical protein